MRFYILEVYNYYYDYKLYMGRYMYIQYTKDYIRRIFTPV